MEKHNRKKKINERNNSVEESDSDKNVQSLENKYKCSDKENKIFFNTLISDKYVHNSKSDMKHKSDLIRETELEETKKIHVKKKLFQQLKRI